MGLKLLVAVLLIKIVAARITVDVNEKLEISYSGTETRTVSSDDINNFNIGEDNLKSGLEKKYQRRPSDAYLTSSPFGLYRTYNLEPVKKVVSIKSARVKSISKKPVIVVTQDFENSSNKTIKVNTGISHSIANTLTTSWSREQEYSVSQDIEYGFNVEIARVGGRTGFSYTYRGGESQQKSITETIGSTSGVEVELKPGDAVTAILSATVGIFEIEVVHGAYLRGVVAANFYPTHRGHYFYFTSIETVLANLNMVNDFTTTETMRFNYYAEAKLNVYNKKNAML